MKFENSLAARDFYTAKPSICSYVIALEGWYEITKSLNILAMNSKNSCCILEDVRTLPLLKYIQG